MRRVQQILSSAAELNGADKQQPSEPSAIALKDKRLTFTWLDGEAIGNNILYWIFYCFCCQITDYPTTYMVTRHPWRSTL